MNKTLLFPAVTLASFLSVTCATAGSAGETNVTTAGDQAWPEIHPMFAGAEGWSVLDVDRRWKAANDWVDGAKAEHGHWRSTANAARVKHDKNRHYLSLTPL
jgi:hypothetical protein